MNRSKTPATEVRSPKLLVGLAGIILCGVVFLLSSRRVVMPTAIPRAESTQAKNEPPNSFLYFAYGSDLVLSRLKAGGGPSAQLVGIGKVEGREFAFSHESKVWRGGVADIVPSIRSEAWGAVYRLKSDDEASLNKQKGVDKADPLYERIKVRVRLSNGQTVEAASFSIVSSKRLPNGAPPTPQYKDCIVRGAEEQGLPDRYIDSIRRIEDNGSTYRRKNTC